MADIKDRIVEFKRVKASDLKPHPQNLRRHGDAQRAAMQAMLNRIGYAGACIVIKRKKKYVILDGHLRAETTPDTEVPVLVVDLDDNEALALLAGHDKIGEMAEWDYEGVAAMLKKLNEEQGIDSESLGWSEEELQAIVDLEPTEEPDESPASVPEPGENVTAEQTCPSCGHKFSGG